MFIIVYHHSPKSHDVALGIEWSRRAPKTNSSFFLVNTLSSKGFYSIIRNGSERIPLEASLFQLLLFSNLTVRFALILRLHCNNSMLIEVDEVKHMLAISRRAVAVATTDLRQSNRRLRQRNLRTQRVYVFLSCSV